MEAITNESHEQEPVETWSFNSNTAIEMEDIGEQDSPTSPDIMIGSPQPSGETERLKSQSKTTPEADKVTEEDNGDQGNCKSSCGVMDLFKRISNSMLVQRIKESCLVKVIRRFLPLMLSCWMLVDIGLDINQTLTFYQHGIGKTGIYQKWAKDFQKKSNGRLQTVSPIYFYVACTVWAAPPFLMGLVFMIIQEDFFFCEIIETFCKRTISLRTPDNKILRCLLKIVLFPSELLSYTILVYIMIPFAAVKNGIKRAWNGEVDEDEELIWEIDQSQLPFWKTFEYCGEALPQFILTILFAINNYPFLLAHETAFGIQIPVTLISVVFSFGSLIIGLVTGLPASYEALC